MSFELTSNKLHHAIEDDVDIESLESWQLNMLINASDWYATQARGNGDFEFAVRAQYFKAKCLKELMSR